MRLIALLGQPRASSMPIAAVVAIATALLAWLLSNPSYNVAVQVPVNHFYIVTAVAAVALIVSLLTARVALQIQHYRVLFLALGFMTMAGMFVVHGLATPGVLVGRMIHTPAHGAAFGVSVGPPTVIAISAFLSLFIPSLFFAASYTRFAVPFEHRLPFRPTALMITIVTLLALYAAVALGTPFLTLIPLGRPPYSYVLAAATVLLLLWSAWQQARPYFATKLPVIGALLVAYLFLALAQVAMILSPLWTLAWWEYHLLMLSSVTLALGTLLVEYRKGQTLRGIFEGALGLRVEVGAELENVETIAALAAATELKDPYTKGHTIRVAELAVAIGRYMELPVPNLGVLARAGLLHDVGKLAIPDAVLLKPGPLTPEEWEVMKRHPQLGLDMLERIGTLRRESLVLSTHHERIDGTGYNRALAGDEIPLEARVIAVADTFDALVTDRPYRKGMPLHAALDIVREESGDHLFPEAVDALCHIMEDPLLSAHIRRLYQKEQPEAPSPEAPPIGAPVAAS